jgi:hypothetical protein
MIRTQEHLSRRGTAVALPEPIPLAIPFHFQPIVCPTHFARPINFPSVGPCRHRYASSLSASIDPLCTSVSLKRSLT